MVVDPHLVRLDSKNRLLRMVGALGRFRLGSSFDPADDPATTDPDKLSRERSCSLRVRHILVPLDCSALAECIVPFAVGLAEVFSARITLLRVLEPLPGGMDQHVDPVEWEIARAEAHQHLSRLKDRLEVKDLRANVDLVEGRAAEQIILFAKQHGVDLIALSSHGESGLSSWALSSTIQKVVALTHTSLFVVPAYADRESTSGELRFAKILLPLDCSPRAECTLAFASALARKHDGTLILTHVVQEPELTRRMPPSEEDRALADQLTTRNREAAERYLTELQERLAVQGVRSEVRIVVSHRRARSIRALAERENADLVLVAAHGRTGDPGERYGGVAARLVQECPKPLMMVQDLAREVHELSTAEEAARGQPGH